MDNKWWQELLNFFLREIDLTRIFHMLLIFIVLVIISPTSFKQMIDLHNPEIFPNHAMYHALLLCISFFLSNATRLFFGSISSRFSDSFFDKKIKALSMSEKELLRFFLSKGNYVVYLRNHNHVVESLVRKGVLKKMYDPNCALNEEGYIIEDKYYLHILNLFRHTY